MLKTRSVKMLCNCGNKIRYRSMWDDDFRLQLFQRIKCSGCGRISEIEYYNTLADMTGAIVIN